LGVTSRPQAGPVISTIDVVQLCQAGFAVGTDNAQSASRKATCFAYLDAVVAAVVQIGALANKGERGALFCLPNSGRPAQPPFFHSTARAGQPPAPGAASRSLPVLTAVLCVPRQLLVSFRQIQELDLELDIVLVRRKLAHVSGGLRVVGGSRHVGTTPSVPDRRRC